MKLDPFADFAAILLATETALSGRYPPTAAQLFAELSAIVGTSKYHGIFEKARLLITADEVSEPQFEAGGPLVDGYLLPFMRDGEGESPCIYGFYMAQNSSAVRFGITGPGSRRESAVDGNPQAIVEAGASGRISVS